MPNAQPDWQLESTLLTLQKYVVANAFSKSYYPHYLVSLFAPNIALCSAVAMAVTYYAHTRPLTASFAYLGVFIVKRKSVKKMEVPLKNCVDQNWTRISLGWGELSSVRSKISAKIEAVEEKTRQGIAVTNEDKDLPVLSARTAPYGIRSAFIVSASRKGFAASAPGMIYTRLRGFRAA